MMINISRKLKAARKKFGLNQVEIASATGLSQRDVSLLENAKREFIPTGYIQYLFKQGLDLNWLFNDEANENTPGHKAPNFNNSFHTHYTGKKYVINKKTDLNGEKEEVINKILIVDSRSAIHYPLNYHKEEYLDNLPYLYLPEKEFQGVEYRCFQVEESTLEDSLQPFHYLICLQNSIDNSMVQEGEKYVVVQKKGISVKRLLKINTEIREMEFSLSGEQIPEEKIAFDHILELWQVKGKVTFEKNEDENVLLKNILDIKTQLNNLSRKIDGPNENNE